MRPDKTLGKLSGLRDYKIRTPPNARNPSVCGPFASLGLPLKNFLGGIRDRKSNTLTET
jgi:hypothetical protein